MNPFSNLFPKTYRNFLYTYLSPQITQVFWLVFVLLTNIVLQLINPQIIGYFIDTAMTGVVDGKLYFAVLIFIAIALITQVFSIAVKYLSEAIAWSATNALRSDLVKHCLYLNFSFHKSRTPGELIERVDGDVNALSRFFSQMVIDIFGNIILLLGILSVLFWQNKLAGTCLGIFSAIALFSLLGLRPFAIAPWTKYRQVSAEFFGFIGEHISGLEDIRGNGAINYVMHRFLKFQQQWLSVYHQARFAATTLWGSTVGLFTVGNALGLAITAYLWKQQDITIGVAYILFYYTNLLQEPIEKIREQLEEFQQAEASIYRIQEILNLPRELDTQSGNVLGDRRELKGISVDFENVCFNYEPDNHETINNLITPDSKEWILQDISFDLKANRVLGIVGQTGSGKTTITRLLLKFYQPQLGSIYFNKIPITQISTQELSQHIGVVTQDVQIFKTTIRNNLTFYDENISDTQILDVLDDLNLSTWLNSLPQGLDTELNLESTGISAGEAQLLAFARVFLKNPSLIILDEASSRLDGNSEKLLETAIDKLLLGRTAIIIAHRLQSLQRADEILILENGRVIEYGDRQTLTNKLNSYFT